MGQKSQGIFEGGFENIMKIEYHPNTRYLYLTSETQDDVRIIGKLEVIIGVGARQPKYNEFTIDFDIDSLIKCAVQRK